VNLNLRSLRNFLKVTTCGSISRAAIELHITQPSLTQHLKHLEDYFGTPLFMRHGRGVVLTEAGKLLRLKGEILIEQIEDLRGEVESSTARPRGTLAIGMPISWSQLVTYPVIARYRREYPDVRIKLVVNPSEALATAMHNNEIQLAVLTETDDPTQFWSRPIVEDGVFLVGPASSGLHEDSPVTLNDLVNYPMIMPLNMTLVFRRIDRALAAAGLALNGVLETATTNILPLIERGVGFATLSAAALPPLGPQSPFAATPISGMSMAWAVATPKNRPKTAAVSVFEEMLAEQIADSVSSGRWRTGKILTQTDDLTKQAEARAPSRLRL
jgi:LysR family transcriptional regulator, nitrogen assimilation regulatory protein